MALANTEPLTPEELALLPHDSLGPSLAAIIWVLTLLAAGFLSLRLYCKRRYSGSFWWDDAILTASFVLLLIDVCITSYLISLGYGRHIWDFPPENFPKFALPVAVRGVLSLTALAWSKTAFGVTLLRLTQGGMKHLVWFIIVSVNIALGISALLFFVQCKPLAAAWDPTVEGTCMDGKILYHYNLFSGAYGAAMDFVLALLPWKLLMALQMRKKEKIGAALAMSMGMFAGIAAIVKTVNLDKLHNGEMYDTVQLFIWDTVEASITIVAASIPVLRVLVRDVHSSITKSNRPSRINGYGYATSNRSKPSRIALSHLGRADKDGEGERSYNDSRSDKSILYETQVDVQAPGVKQEDGEGNGILRTDTVVVQFAGRRGADDRDLEEGRRR